MPRSVDVTLKKFPFSQVSYLRELEEGDIPKAKRSMFEFDYIGSDNAGGNFGEECDIDELDEMLISELGSNLDELSRDNHLPTLS